MGKKKMRVPQAVVEEMKKKGELTPEMEKNLEILPQAETTGAGKQETKPVDSSSMQDVVSKVIIRTQGNKQALAKDDVSFQPVVEPIFVVVE